MQIEWLICIHQVLLFFFFETRSEDYVQRAYRTVNFK